MAADITAPGPGEGREMISGAPGKQDEVEGEYAKEGRPDSRTSLSASRHTKSIDVGDICRK